MLMWNLCILTIKLNAHSQDYFDYYIPEKYYGFLSSIYFGKDLISFKPDYNSHVAGLTSLYL